MQWKDGSPSKGGNFSRKHQVSKVEGASWKLYGLGAFNF